MNGGDGRLVLITGASGFIGRRLRQPGDRALVRRLTGLPDEALGELSEPASLALACKGVDTVFHCAGLAAVDDRDGTRQWQINYLGTRNLIGAATAAGVRRFVFMSSVKAMAEPGEACADEDWPGGPVGAYGQSKRAAEDLVLEAGARHGMHVVVLRLAPVYGRGGGGNLGRLARLARHHGLPAPPETGNRRSLVHVEDVVRAVRLVAEHPAASGQVYIVADPRSYSTRQIYDAMRAALGLGPARWEVPAGMLRRVAGAHPRLRAAIERLTGSACYSPARIERDLGFRAQIDLAAGLREMLR